MLVNSFSRIDDRSSIIARVEKRVETFRRIGSEEEAEVEQKNGSISCACLSVVHIKVSGS